LSHHVERSIITAGPGNRKHWRYFSNCSSPQVRRPIQIKHLGAEKADALRPLQKRQRSSAVAILRNFHVEPSGVTAVAKQSAFPHSPFIETRSSSVYLFARAR